MCVTCWTSFSKMKKNKTSKVELYFCKKIIAYILLFQDEDMRENSKQISLFVMRRWGGGGRVKATSYLDLRVDAEQREESVHVNQGLPCLPVHGAQEVEREGELEEQAVDHHQVSHSHGPCVAHSNTQSPGKSPTLLLSLCSITCKKATSEELIRNLSYGKPSPSPPTVIYFLP